MIHWARSEGALRDLHPPGFSFVTSSPVSFKPVAFFFFLPSSFLRMCLKKKLSEQVLKIESDLAKWAASDDFFPEIKTKSKNKRNICFLFQNSFRVITKIGEQVLSIQYPAAIFYTNVRCWPSRPPVRPTFYISWLFLLLTVSQVFWGF